MTQLPGLRIQRQDTKMEIEFSSEFRKQYLKSNKKIKNAFSMRLKLFQQNSYHPLLRNHQLTGGYKSYQSINITGDWRAIYSQRGNTITFKFLGTHSQLYK